MTLRYVVAAMCALGACAPSVSAAESPIVAPGGTIAGKGYSDWLVTSWRLALAKPPPPAPCHRVLGVTVVLGGFSGKKERHTCSVPKGGAVYVGGFGAECSTIEDPPFHGDTPAQLKRCAMRYYKTGKNVTQELDGKPYPRYVTASAPFIFHMPKKNLLGTKKRTGRAVAYGDGLLLRNLSPGTHVIRGRATAPDFKADVTFTLKVAG